MKSSEDLYREKLPLYNSLEAEIRHILDSSLSKSGIKFDSIETRIKSISSINLKAASKKLDAPLDQLADVVGARVICLFKSDLDAVGALIRDNFNVESVDDKIQSAPDSFGYLSIHYICRIPEKYKGPRYDDIKNIGFEIQVRTLCMHSWASVSHYLDYKSDYDVPDAMKKSLSALSGLFYIADDQFESAYKARISSKRAAESAAKQISDIPVEINFDTLSALASRLFPDRPILSSQTSDLSEELKRFGFVDLREVERKVLSVSDEFLLREKNYQGEAYPYFTAMGAIRVSLGLEDSEYEDFNLNKILVKNNIVKKKKASRNL